MSNKRFTSKERANANVTRENPVVMRRRLRNIDRSMKNITDLLKGTPRNSQSKNNSNNKTQENSKLKNTTSTKNAGFSLDHITDVPLTKSLSHKSTKRHKPIITPPEITIDAPKSKPEPDSFNIKPNITIKKCKRIKVKENIEKVEDQDQYCPGIAKRKWAIKHNWLKPQHKYKTVCKVDGVLRRKLYVPKKGGEPQMAKRSVPRAVTLDLDVKELVRAMDDEGLDEEDFMAILTCPSPVWWESPDLGDYDEDAIPMQVAIDTRFIDKELKTSENNLKEVESNVAVLDMIIQKDDKFMKKRSKLEKLLGNMKNVNPNDGKCAQDSNKSHVANEKLNDIIAIKEEIEDTDNDSVKTINDEGNIIANDFTMLEESETNAVVLKSQNTATNVDPVETKNKEAEIIVITIENDTDTTAIENNNEESCHTETKNIEEMIIDTSDPDDVVTLTKNVASNRDCHNRISLSSDDMSFDGFPDDKMLNDLENMNIPIVTVKTEDKEIIEILDDDVATSDGKSTDSQLSPMSNKSITSGSVIYVDNLDSISDTNIQYIDAEVDQTTKESEDIKKDPIPDTKDRKNRIIDTYKQLMQNINRKDGDSAKNTTETEIKQ